MLSKIGAGPRPTARSQQLASPDSAEPMRPAIGYATPKGKPHTFRVKQIARVWSRLENFFRGCTDADPLRPASATLTFSESKSSQADPRQSTFLEQARAAFGASRPSAWSGLGAVFPDMSRGNLEPLFGGGVQHQWTLSPDQVEAAIQLLIAGDPWAASLIPVASLTLLHRFAWKDTRRADSPPDSMCITSLASRSALTPYLLFPFESADESFLAYLRHIKPLLPLPLSANNFRLFQPSGKKGNRVPRVIGKSAIAQVLA
jgi:hypothetical protein